MIREALQNLNEAKSLKQVRQAFKQIMSYLSKDFDLELTDSNDESIEYREKGTDGYISFDADDILGVFIGVDDNISKDLREKFTFYQKKFAKGYKGTSTTGGNRGTGGTYYDYGYIR